MAMLPRMLVIGIAAVFLINMAMAKNYDVGAPGGGWDLTTSLQAWANGITFVQGDTITFVYGPSHSVLEVTKPDYDSCLTNASVASYADGNTTISLNSIGNRYFICGTPTHCDRGMKVVITTTTAPSAPPPAATTPASPPTPAESHPSKTPTVSPTVAPVIAPAKSPKISPKISPSKAPVRSPSKSPVSSPPPVLAQEPAAESPTSPPSRSTTPSSSANKINIFNGITMGVGFILMLLAP